MIPDHWKAYWTWMDKAAFLKIRIWLLKGITSVKRFIVDFWRHIILIGNFLLTAFQKKKRLQWAKIRCIRQWYTDILTFYSQKMWSVSQRLLKTDNLVSNKCYGMGMLFSNEFMEAVFCRSYFKWTLNRLEVAVV